MYPHAHQFTACPSECLSLLLFFPPVLLFKHSLSAAVMLVAMEIDIRVSYFYSLEFDRCQLSVESFVLTQTRVIISKDKTSMLIHSV